jgi:hypothetical protein
MASVYWTAIGAIATVIGVGLVLWQMESMRDQARADCNDKMSSEYRALITQLPIRAIYGEDLSDAEFQEVLPVLYGYFDLSNQQILLRNQKRVNEGTWHEWSTGIKSNLNLPVFDRAWKLVQLKKPHDFQELSRFQGVVSDDPRRW